MSAPAVAAVQARVAAIESRFRALGPVPTGSARPARGTPTEASFATTLTAATAQVDGGGADGEAVVAAARRYLGVPYRWGGTDPATGLDCSGFVQRAFADLGIDLPRVSADQARAGVAVGSMAEARPGDLLAFDFSADRPGIDHIGIYAGEGKMVVAPKAGDVVKVQDVTRAPVAIRRVVGGGSGAAAVPSGAAVGSAGTLESLFASAGARHGVDPSLLQAVARAESGFDPRAVSRAGAQGLMQLMPATASSLGVDPFDPAQAVDGAARLLREHLGRFGSLPLALAAYNAGPGAVSRHGGIPPYAETQKYVSRIMAELEEVR